jgi:hypothetical protein
MCGNDAYSTEMKSGLNSQHMEQLFGKPGQWNQTERQCRQDNIITLSGLGFYHPSRLEANLERREDAWALDRAVAVPNPNITSCIALEVDEPRSANTGGSIQSFESSRTNINESLTLPQLLEHICIHAKFAEGDRNRAQLTSGFPFATPTDIGINAAIVKARKEEKKARLDSKPKNPRTARNYYLAEVYAQIKAEHGTQAPIVFQTQWDAVKANKKEHHRYQQMFLDDKERYKREVAVAAAALLPEPIEAESMLASAPPSPSASSAEAPTTPPAAPTTPAPVPSSPAASATTPTSPAAVPVSPATSPASAAALASSSGSAESPPLPIKPFSCSTGQLHASATTLSVSIPAGSRRGTVLGVPYDGVLYYIIVPAAVNEDGTVHVALG